MTNNALNQPIKYLGISTAVVLVAAFVLVQPMNAYSQVGAEGILLNNCSLAAQPEDPIDMNTVVGTKTTGRDAGNEFAKTIHREKQILSCLDANDPSLPSYIVEIAIFLEIIEDMDQKKIVRKQSEVITCIKEPEEGTVLECQKRLPSSTQSISVFDCTQVFTATHTVEQNTVVDPDNVNIIKTVEAEKEIFTCLNGVAGPDPLKKVDVVIFTELWENLNNLNSNPVFKRNVESARCTMSVPLAIVESCIFTTHTLAPVP